MDLPVDVQEWVEDVEGALVDAGISHEAACIDMGGLDNSQWTRMRKTGRIDSARLALLGDDFQRAFAERRAARFNVDPEAAKAERLRKLLHALVDAVDVFPMVKAGLAQDAEIRRAG